MILIGELEGGVGSNKTANHSFELARTGKKSDMPNITGELTPSDTESFTSGGTAHILPKEREKASFDGKIMTNALDGGKKMTAKRKFIM